MISIQKSNVPETELRNNIKKVGDLQNFEGSVLSVLKDHRNDDLYIYDWIDADSKHNRWLVFKVEKDSLRNYINKKVSLKELENEIHEFYYADIDERIEYKIFKAVGELPQKYQIDKDLYFDEDDSVNLEEIKKAVNLHP